MARNLRVAFIVTACVLAALSNVSVGWSAKVPSPRDAFGFEPGADRQLIDYSQLTDYLQDVADASARVELRKVGRSPLGRDMYVVFISSAENIASLDQLGEMNRRLALEPDLGDRLERLVSEAKVFVMATLSMHSSEVGPSQALPLLTWQLATTSDAATLAHLENVVLMIVPCHNPDGMDMVVEHYRSTRGTRYEGASLPGVYHRYVGHDNNRDFVALTQEDSRVINRLFSTEWYPQVMVEKHQMGGSGPRYFVPPNHDPIAENIDERLWRWSAVFGTDMARRMTADGLKGVAQHWLFDEYWPGSTGTSLWKNVITFLTEAASCQVAKPVRVEPGELQVRGKGLSEYSKSVNMPDPWPGGWWRLGDIVSYELSSHYAVLETASLHREKILRLRNELCRLEVRRGREQAPYAFVLPSDQHDHGELVELARLLDEHGVEISMLEEDVLVDGRLHRAGDLLVSMSQPYRPFIKEVMERQLYPVRHYTPGGEIIRPYDITSWSLPLHRGVEVIEIDAPAGELEARARKIDPEELMPRVKLGEGTRAVAFSCTENAAFAAAFKAVEMGLEVLRLDEPQTVGETTLVAGSFVVRAGSGSALAELVEGLPILPVVLPSGVKGPMTRLEIPRIALIETWFHDMDAGWTRFLLDTYRVPYRVIRPGEVKDIDLAAEIDLIIFPDADSETLRSGRRKYGDRYYASDLPPEKAAGLGKEGMNQVLRFLDQGGRIVAWRRSVPLFLGLLEMPSEKGDSEEGGADAAGEAFELPVRDRSEEASKTGLEIPGAFLRVEVLQDHPLTRGMPASTGVFSRGTPVLQTSIPSLDMDRRVLAWFPERELLLSGYAKHEDQLARKPAMIWVRKGKGQLVLFSFNPQFRASTPATYKLLLSSLLLPPVTGAGS